jgi:hypothetical protein
MFRKSVFDFKDFFFSLIPDLEKLQFFCEKKLSSFIFGSQKNGLIKHLYDHNELTWHRTTSTLQAFACR